MSMRWVGLVALALLLSGCPPLAGVGPLPEQSAAAGEDGKGEAPVKKDGTTSAGKNHLAQEKSPYLLQHADNPVDWYPWGEEAFARARKEDKPIFLSIGYAACHWCHVMEHESFEDEAVAAFLNEHFISIKVDREERPDVDTIYMTACQAMTGGGGWPLTAFLTPDLEPFFAGTYFPPQDAHGRPGFMTLLNWVTQGWVADRAELEKQAKKLSAAIVDMQRNSGGDDLPAESLLVSYVSQCTQRFDGQNGGFGRAPKFPRPAVLDLLLRTWKRSEDASQLDMVVRTLDAMAGGGMYDQVGGGFHRYSVDAQWLVPHFEKMLYDNAQLVRTYLDAWLITGDQRQARIVRECLDWTLREMTHEAGGFFSSLDADSLDAAGHKEEGAFYTWTPGELEEVLGKEQASLYSTAFGVTDAGNFEGSGRTVLFVSRSLDQVASDTGKPLETVAQLLAEAREKLRQAREARPRPGLDDKVLTSWNGLMIGAMARAGARLPEPRYTAAATQAASFVLENLRDADGRLLRRWRDGDAAFKAYVDDYAFLGNGLVDLYEATWDPRWLMEARGLARDLVKLFADEDRGGFFFTGSDHEKLLARSKDPYDGALPSGNSMAALLLARVSGYTLDAGMRDHARRTVAAFARELEKMPFAHPMLAVVFQRLLDKGREVVIAGDPEAEATVALVGALRKRFLPGVVVATVPAAGASEDLSDLILLTGKTAVDGRPAAYVCEGGVCHQPVTSVAELEKALDGE